MPEETVKTITEDELVKALDTLAMLARAGMSDEDLEKALGIEGDEDLSKGWSSESAEEKNEGEEEAGDGDADESEEEAGDGGEDEGEEREEGGDVEKSFGSNLDQSDSIQSAVEVSEFLADLVKGIQDGMAEIGAEMGRMRRYQMATIETLQKSLAAVSGELKSAKAEIEDLKKSHAEGIEDLRKSFEDGGMRPAHPRKAAKVTVLEKSFAGDRQEERAEPLTRTQISNKLMDLCKSGKIGENEVLKFESIGIGGLQANTLKLLGLQMEQ